MRGAVLTHTIMLTSALLVAIAAPASDSGTAASGTRDEPEVNASAPALEADQILAWGEYEAGDLERLECRVTVVEFRTSLCVPCCRSLPNLKAVALDKNDIEVKQRQRSCWPDTLVVISDDADGTNAVQQSPRIVDDTRFEIAYVASAGEDAPRSLRLADLGGTRNRDIVSSHEAVVAFTVSQDGRQIAYVSDPDDTETFQLHVLDLLANEKRSVSDGIRFAPTFSPDGHRLAFMKYSRRWQIELTNPELTITRPEQEHIGGDGAPSFSPDGSWVVFYSNRDGNMEIYRADANTGELMRLTDTPEIGETMPLFSPDGRWISYVRHGNVWLMEPDGANPRNLTARIGRARDVAWTPDSATIVFSADDDGDGEIYRIDIRTGELTKLTTNDSDDRSPSVSPTGGMIAFVSDREGVDKVYIMKADGSGQRRLTDSVDESEAMPAWRIVRDQGINE